MVRTKADSAGVRVASAKAPRKNFGGSSRPSTSSSVAEPGSASKKDRFSGGNPVCPRETPKWQKPIASFFTNSISSSPTPSNDGEKENRSPKSNKQVVTAEISTSNSLKSVENIPSSSSSDCQPGCSGVRIKKTAKRRIRQILDSDEDDTENMDTTNSASASKASTSCVVNTVDEITEA